MNPIPPELSIARERFQALVAELRPELHRYCTRLVGSVIDGEDVLQESLAKAFYTLAASSELPPLRPWLMRIAHNTAVDFLRRYERRFVEPVAEVPEQPFEPDESELDFPEARRLALSSFLALTVVQRGAVILKDVLGFTLEEVAATLATTVPAVKAALVRGRRALAARPVPEAVAWRDRPETSPEEGRLLERYLALFNTQDWAGLRDLLAEECRLDLVSRAARRGRAEITPYFGNYAREATRLVLAEAEGRLVLGACRGGVGTRPDYIITLDWRDGQVLVIRDYRYVPYLIDELELGPA